MELDAQEYIKVVSEQRNTALDDLAMTTTALRQVEKELAELKDSKT